MSILKSAGFKAIRLVCAMIANLIVGGWLIGQFIANGYDETPGRDGGHGFRLAGS